MNAQDYFKAGNVNAAVTALENEIRNAPGDLKLRLFLFQLLCVRGEWTRAITQLNVVAGLSDDGKMLAAVFHPLVLAEAFREEVFSGRRMPLLFGEPDPWMSDMLQALSHFAAGHLEAAQKSRELAIEGAPVVSGTVNDQRFTWIEDGDSRIGPFLEVILQGRYFWVPLCRIKSVNIEPPSDLRDLIWLPAQFVWSNEGEAVGHIPVRYAGTEKSSDDASRLARRTEWMPMGDVGYRGEGQRMFMSNDGGEFALLDIRKLTLAVS